MHRAWTRLDIGWFVSRTDPVLRGDGPGTALVLGSEGDDATSPLLLRRWRESAPVSERAVVGGPRSHVSSMSFLRMADGSVEVIWLEPSSGVGGVSGIVWTRGVRVVSREAGV